MRTSHGMMVNLYQMREMFKDEATGLMGINDVYAMLRKSYEVDKFHMGHAKQTFSEYVDDKRHFTASILGIEKYL